MIRRRGKAIRNSKKNIETMLKFVLYLIQKVSVNCPASHDSTASFLPPDRPATSIAAAVGGVVLFFILVALLVFYLRRQRHLRRKETMRRILQEHEVRKVENGGWQTVEKQRTEGQDRGLEGRWI